jgi:hypothetical protein
MPDPVEAPSDPTPPEAVNIDGGVKIKQGDFIGRDKNISVDKVEFVNQLDAEEIKQLAREILQSESRVVFPPNLQYRVNRDLQAQELRALYTKSRAYPQALPIVCIFHGDQKQANDMFLERLETEFVPNILQINAAQTPISLFYWRWPAYLKNIRDLKDLLEQNLADAILNTPAANCKDMQRTLAAFNSPAIVAMELLTDDWLKHREGILEHILMFWNDWPELAPRQTLFVFLYITYKMPTLSWLKKRRYLERKKQISIQLARCAFEQYPKLHGTVFTELTDVFESEARDWARMVARKFLGRDTAFLEAKIATLFEEHGSLPMGELASELKKLLDSISDK